MAVSLSDLRLRLAYRLNENGSPGDTNEVARRDSFFNEAYRKVIGEQYWWFSNTISSDSSVDGQEIYTLASDYRDMIELRLNRKICLPIADSDAFSTYNYPPLYYQYRSIVQKFYVYGESDLHLLPLPSTTPSALSVDSITQTGGVATVTTDDEHELQANDYVLIAGADQSDYNGTFRVLTAPTSTTFTVTVESTATSPATGTITATWKNIVYRYWQYPTALTAATDTVIIPDQYADILVAYAYGRYGYVDDSRANSADGFEEYNNILKDMKREQNRKEHWWKQTPPLSHEYYHE
jgi:hypothetical protein